MPPPGAPGGSQLEKGMWAGAQGFALEGASENWVLRSPSFKEARSFNLTA